MKQRIGTCLLTLVVLLSMLPISALAADGDEPAGSTVTVSVDKASFGPGTEFSGVTGIRFERYTTGSGAELETTPVAEGQADFHQRPCRGNGLFLCHLRGRADKPDGGL